MNLQILEYYLMAVMLNVMAYIKGGMCLNCYSCESEQSNAMCLGEENFEKCPDEMDTCQTVVHYSDVSEKLDITKKCTMNISCEYQLNATKDDIPCDRGGSSWICTSCCYEDFCNTDAAVPRHLVSIATITMATSLTAVMVGGVQLLYGT